MKRALWVCVAVAFVSCDRGTVRNEQLRKPPPDSDAPCGPETQGGFGGFGGSSGTTGAPAPSSEPLPIEDGPVVTPARPPPAVSGGTLAALSDGSFAAADPDRDVVWLLGSDRSTVRRIDLQRGDEPGRVVEGAGGRIFVALRGTGDVAEIDVPAGSVVARRFVCGAPRGMAWLQSSATLAVACASGTLARLSFDAAAATAPVYRSMQLQHPAEDLRDVVAGTGDILWVSSFRGAKLFAVGPTGNAVDTQFSGGQLDGSQLMTRGVAWRMVATPTGIAMIHQWSSLDQVGAKVAGCGGMDAPEYASADQGSLVQGGLSTMESGSMRELPIGTLRAPSVDVAMSSNAELLLANYDRGASLFVSGGIFATLESVGQVTSVAWAGDTAVLFSREPAMFVFWPKPLAEHGFSAVNLSAASVRSTGHELFHRMTQTGLACASCHPEAGDDGRVWLLPEGPRRTPSLRGGLSGTAPFHWSGDLNGMQPLMDEVMVRRMGGNPQTEPRNDALLAWLDAQPAHSAPEGIDASAALRGKALFESTAVGCTTCHTGVQGTNNATVDVGTGAAFQVPRLRELGLRAPYFHDGRIGTLEERFLPSAGGELHGHTAQLTAQDRADLVQYLRTL
jgi:mono/diheme cytochrome c family protein